MSLLGSVSRRAISLFGVVAVAGSVSLFSGAVPLAAASAVPRVAYGDFLLSNWAGYIAPGSSGQFTTVTASWVEPAVTCHHSDLYAPWVGIDGYANMTVEQTGVQTECSGRSASYSAWYEMYPASPVYYSNPVSVNDAFTATVSSSGDTYTLKIEDVTKGWTETTTKSQSSAEGASAEAVIEAPGGYPGITSVNFTGVKFDGAALDTYSLVKSKSDSGPRTTVYKPTKITDGDDFSIVPKT
ncbi:MAG: G1 family glutamic endopeptidase [Acidimicrobiales bacterium]